jgi:hypothetical protein
VLVAGNGRGEDVTDGAAAHPVFAARKSEDNRGEKQSEGSAAGVKS